MAVTTTTWHRLEPRVRGGDPAIGLKAAVHDPLWLLGRQWQMGELSGEDAAFPVAVRVETEAHPLSRFRAGDAGAPVAYDPAARPLEEMVERELPRAPTLRQRLDAWTRLRAMLEAAGQGALAAPLAAAHPLPPAPEGVSDPADVRLRLLAGANAVDGLAVAAALAANPGAVPAAVVAALQAWIAAQAPAGAGDCWVTDRLEYRFAVAAGAPEGEVALAAPHYTGGRLDWYDLDLDADPARALGAAAPEPATAVTYLLPSRISFSGMPAGNSGNSRTGR